MDGLSLVASEVGLASDGRLAGSTTVDGWPSVSRGSGVVRFTKGGVIAAARSASSAGTATATPTSRVLELCPRFAVDIASVSRSDRQLVARLAALQRDGAAVHAAEIELEAGELSVRRRRRCDCRASAVSGVAGRVRAASWYCSALRSRSRVFSWPK